MPATAGATGVCAGDFSLTAEATEVGGGLAVGARAKCQIAIPPALTNAKTSNT